ncbi:hypothetical protein ACIRQT_33120 [Streptomyces californicus]|uniref:hypothetical protein n=1 Tax=Streptomyces californicus TaxID=67351 RepID=UPI0038123A83
MTMRTGGREAVLGRREAALDGGVRVGRVEEGVAQAEHVQQVEEFSAGDVVLDGVVAVVAAPADDQRHVQVVDEVERGQYVQRVAQARVLHEDHRLGVGRRQAGGDAERRVLAGRGQVGDAPGGPSPDSRTRKTPLRSGQGTPVKWVNPRSAKAWTRISAALRRPGAAAGRSAVRVWASVMGRGLFS